MATKVATKVSKENKASKKESKTARAKVEKKSVKAASPRGAMAPKTAEPVLAAPLSAKAEQPGVDPEEFEEQEENAAAAASNQNSSAAALAAASTGQEMSASFKNFRHHPDMENFYRFIYENDLRHEALAIIDEVLNEKRARRELKSAKAQAH